MWFRRDRSLRIESHSDVFEVLYHRLVRRLLVVAPDGFQDAAIALERDLRPLDGSEMPRLRVLEQVVDDLHDPLYDCIMRCSGQEVVKLRVLLRAGLASLRALFLPVYDVLEQLQILRCGARGGRPCYLRLEEQPRVHEFLPEVAHAVQHAGDGRHQVFDGNLPDVVAPTVAALHQAGHLELADGLPYHGAAHLELLGELPLRRQSLAGVQRTAGYEVADPGRHLLVEFDAPDRLDRRLRCIHVDRFHTSSLTSSYRLSLTPTPHNPHKDEPGPLPISPEGGRSRRSHTPLTCSACGR